MMLMLMRITMKMTTIVGEFRFWNRVTQFMMVMMIKMTIKKTTMKKTTMKKTTMKMTTMMMMILNLE